MIMVQSLIISENRFVVAVDLIATFLFKKASKQAFP